MPSSPFPSPVSDYCKPHAKLATNQQDSFVHRFDLAIESPSEERDDWATGSAVIQET